MARSTARFALLALALLTTFISTLGAAEWISKIDITAQEDQRLVDTMPARGFVPIYSKETFTPDNQSRYDVVYLKVEVAAWEYRKYNDEDFRRKDRELRDKGYELVSQQSYRVNGAQWHNCIWHKNR